MSKFWTFCFLVPFFQLLGSACYAKGAIQTPEQTNQQADSCTVRALLNQYERSQFVKVSMGQQAEVLAQYLSAEGCEQQMFDGMRNLGGTIRYSDKRSGYALVSISKDKLLDTLDLPGIAYAYTRYIDDPQDAAVKRDLADRKAEPVPAVTIPYPRVATTLPKDGPYFAADEIGLTELWKQNHEADGRGVRVAVPDVGFDLLHPAVQQARDAAGNIVLKIADLGTLTSPDEDSGWVRFGEPIHSR